jgi:hypothetical protein
MHLARGNIFFSISLCMIPDERTPMKFTTQLKKENLYLAYLLAGPMAVQTI